MFVLLHETCSTLPQTNASDRTQMLLRPFARSCLLRWCTYRFSRSLGHVLICCARLRSAHDGRHGRKHTRRLRFCVDPCEFCDFGCVATYRIVTCAVTHASLQGCQAVILSSPARHTPPDGLYCFQVVGYCQNWQTRWRFRHIPGPPISFPLGNLKTIRQKQIFRAHEDWSAEYGDICRIFMVQKPTILVTGQPPGTPFAHHDDHGHMHACRIGPFATVTACVLMLATLGTSRSCSLSRDRLCVPCVGRVSE